MTVKYGKFRMPKSVTRRSASEDGENENRAVFEMEPFERSFGHTLGSALRRVLLTSLEAPAVVSIWMEDIPHKYTAIDGVVEDMSTIVLRMKDALLRFIPDVEDENACEISEITTKLDVTSQQIAEAGGQYTICLKDILEDSKFELLNPDLVIFSVVKPFSKAIAVKISFGRGYVSSESQGIEPKMGEIVLDAIFSPVRLVNYYVENTRVGQDTDFDRLILDITTDGRVSPGEALDFAVQIIMLHFKVFDDFRANTVRFDKDESKPDKDRDELLQKLAQDISGVELSVRSANCLQRADIDTIGDLVLTPKEEILQYRNFGKKSSEEIQQRLLDQGLSLGMDLSKYGITRENVREIIKEFKEQQ